MMYAKNNIITSITDVKTLQWNNEFVAWLTFQGYLLSPHKLYMTYIAGYTEWDIYIFCTHWYLPVMDN